MLTLEDVKDYLKRVDEISLLEILDVSSEELVDRFADVIEDNYDELAREIEADTDEYEEY